VRNPAPPDAAPTLGGELPATHGGDDTGERVTCPSRVRVASVPISILAG
jgi:hypothetical protein